MVNAKMIYMQLSIPVNRSELMKKIKAGSDKKHTKDPEVEDFQYNFLKDWADYDKETKLEFCQWIIDSSSEGYAYGYAKKEEIKKAPGNVINKVKAVFKDGTK
jgi:hypothetical protein